MMPLPPRYLLPVPLPTPFRPGDPRRLDPLGLHVRDTTDPHKVRDRLVDIGVLRKNEDGTYSPYLPMKADLVNGKVPASQLPEGGQGVTDVLVDNVSVVTGGTASISLAGKVDKEQGKGLSSNDYTTEEKAKLSGVEAGAQKNVGEVYTSAEKTKLSGIETGAQKNVGEEYTSAEKAKLSGIETGAQKNVGEEYTSAEKAKLSGVEAGAQKNVAPVAPSTDASAAGKPADAKATGDQLAGKQDTISDLATIRAGAAAGATAYQKPASGIPLTDMADGAVPIYANAAHTVVTATVRDGNFLSVAMFPTVEKLSYAQGDVITASATLADRTGNRVVPLATNTENIVLTFPNAVAGHLRDFLVLVTNTTGNTGSITFTPPTGATVYGDGFTHSPASGETWLYSITEEAANVFWCKSEKMEVAQ